jgi:mannonate dehydratase
MRRPSRRAVLGLLGGGAAALGGARWLLPLSQRPRPRAQRGGTSRARPRALVRAAFDGVVAARVWDSHAPPRGPRQGGTGADIDPEMRSHLHPWKRLQFDVYMAAPACRTSTATDEQFLEACWPCTRREPAGKLLLLAFEPRRGRGAARRSPALPVLRAGRVRAVHRRAASPTSWPARRCIPTARTRWRAWRRPPRAGRAPSSGSRTARASIPPRPAATRFLRPPLSPRPGLISHTGSSARSTRRRTRSSGTRCACAARSSGACASCAAHLRDPRAGRATSTGPSAAPSPGSTSSCASPGARHRGAPLGDLSAVTQVNRSAEAAAHLLTAGDLHPRLVNGSDYPLPSIDLLISTAPARPRDLGRGRGARPAGRDLRGQTRCSTTSS